MMERLRDLAGIMIGLTCVVFMLVVIFPALTLWACIERARMKREQWREEFDGEGRPVLREVEKARAAHEEGWRW